MNRKKFIELAGLGAAGIFSISESPLKTKKRLTSSPPVSQVTDVNNIACLGNGQLAVYESGADILQVFGPPYSAPSAMMLKLDTGDSSIRVQSKREQGTAIWRHKLTRGGKKIGEFIDFVMADSPAFIRKIKVLEPINLYGKIPDNNSWLKNQLNLQEFNVSGAGLSKIPAGTYVYANYPTSDESYHQVVTKGEARLSQFDQEAQKKVSLECQPGTSAFFIIGGPSYPDCKKNTEQLLQANTDELLASTREYWQRFSTRRRNFSNAVSANVSQREKLMQLIDDVSIIIKTQQSNEGAVLAGHNYHLGYVRDQYGVSRGLLKLGYIEEAKSILQFYFNIWAKKGRLHNAQGIGLDAFHVHENDDVEITAYLILQAFDYYHKTKDTAFLKKIFPMLEWAYYRQIQHLKKYMLPFNGDETYVAGGILPRTALLHGSAESTMLFISSAEKLITWAEKTRAWDTKEINQQKELVQETKDHYHKNFVENGKLMTNNPSRMVGETYPEFRHGVCESLVPPCEVFGWTQKTDNNRYLCPTCYATKAKEFPAADPEKYFLQSVSLIPLYIHSKILSEKEIRGLIGTVTKQYKNTGSLPSRPGGSSTVGYDYGLLLYSLSKLNHPLAKEIYLRMLSVVDQTGAWVEYYQNDQPMGTRYRPWESAINLEAALVYAEHFHSKE